MLRDRSLNLLIEFVLFSSALYNLLIISFMMTPTKILQLIIILACFGLAVLAFQLTNGLSDSDSSPELQEAMPALQQ